MLNEGEQDRAIEGEYWRTTMRKIDKVVIVDDGM
jgi:hypothetical protein